MSDGLISTYNICAKDGNEYSFSINMETGAIDSGGIRIDRHAEWTQLSFHQCTNCTLSDTNNSHCLIACRIEHMVEAFKLLVSYETVHVEILNRSRLVCATIPAQKAISSLLGLAIATSSCPHTAFLKPMAKFHLPLADIDETIFRIIGTYLIGELLKVGIGGKIDSSLERLFGIYRELEIMNNGLSKRLQHSGTINDAVINGLIILNCYPQMIHLYVDGGMEVIARAYGDYLARD